MPTQNRYDHIEILVQLLIVTSINMILDGVRLDVSMVTE
jgi:hypothetical protein